MIYFLTVNYYSRELTEKLLQSICVQGEIPYCVAIVNNSPGDESIRELASESVVVLEAGENLGFGGGCNLGLQWIYRQDPQAIVWSINPDAVLLPGMLARVPQFFAMHPEVSILGTIVYDPTGELWFAGGHFIPETGAIAQQNCLTNSSKMGYVICDWVTGCSLLMNLSNFSQCPAFDADYFLYYEDFDFCRRYAALGHLIGITERIAIVHYPSSVADRKIRKKYNYSTYSYLKAMETYTSKIVFALRLLRLVLYAMLLIAVKPAVAMGKLEGVWKYLGRR
ncbi:glycosyltransferase family 2 protein [Phormidium sp. CCY1219]|uniref:glycosyltransferase family 2 protein n=1 Tax=Phormidium sp. CCY1219 TaxID=2886104 RepID=UPI002D76648D|nr:glycosyltransferase family 2 protein [Phormidium sp. CCY1219]